VPGLQTKPLYDIECAFVCVFEGEEGVLFERVEYMLAGERKRIEREGKGEGKARGGQGRGGEGRGGEGDARRSEGQV
jgi:hypothetical protein